MSEQTHRSDPHVLNRRTLQRDHRRLAEILNPGMSVLDVGCGTGAITAGIARQVGPDGSAVGIDRDEPLLAAAQILHSNQTNLTFQLTDVLEMDFQEAFDIVTAARVLQWVKFPSVAIANMTRAVRYGGIVMALDYNHADNRWEPAPPREFTAFYYSFLDWRAAFNWSNRMASDLSHLFANAGLADIRSHLENEVVTRLDPDFYDTASIWATVIETLSPQMVASGNLDPAIAETAADAYREYVANTLYRQTLVLKTVEGRRI